jgi:hypothetical protein
MTFTNCLIKVSAFFFFAAPFALSQSPSMSHGTLIILQPDGNRVLMAADSRRMDRGNPNDHTCKIIQLGDRAFFAAAGDVQLLGADNKVVYDVHDIARSLYEHDGTKDIATIAKLWAEAVREKMQFVLDHNRRVFREEPSLSGIFATATQSQITVYTYEMVMLYPSDKKAIIQPSPNSFVVPAEQGRVEGGSKQGLIALNELAQNKKPWAVAANKDLETLIANNPKKDRVAIKLRFEIKTASLQMTTKTVGGYVDVLELSTKSGNNWLYAKPECRTNPAKNKAAQKPSGLPKKSIK